MPTANPHSTRIPPRPETRHAPRSLLEVTEMQERYLQPHQARKREPTSFENLLGDSIERAFAAGIHDLAGLVDYLNQAGPTCPGGEPWTADAYQTLIARLGE